MDRFMRLIKKKRCLQTTINPERLFFRSITPRIDKRRMLLKKMNEIGSNISLKETSRLITSNPL
jgi:hypothetical protein